MIKYLKRLVRDFFTICGCILIGVSMFLTLFQIKLVNTSLLWQVIMIAFIAALIGCVLIDKSLVSRKSYVIRKIIHFSLVNLLLLSSLYFFKWFFLDRISLIVVFEVIVILVYVLVGLLVYYIDNAHAKKLNKKLIDYKKRRQEENE